MCYFLDLFIDQSVYEESHIFVFCEIPTSPISLVLINGFIWPTVQNLKTKELNDSLIIMYDG